MMPKRNQLEYVLEVKKGDIKMTIHSKKETVEVKALSREALIQKCQDRFGGKNEFKMGKGGYDAFLIEFIEHIDHLLSREIDHYDTDHSRFITDWIDNCAMYYNKA